MIKLVIFDLDGVLIDACEWHRVALNEALKKVCNYEISLMDHYEFYNGLPTKVKLQKLSDQGILSESKHKEVNDLKQQKTIAIIENTAEERKEKIELLNWLKSRSINVACFTNSIRETADLMLKKTGIYDLLELTITNQDVENPKPDPEGYIKVLKYFNCDPRNAIIVEDSPKGLKAAYGAGCKVFRVEDATDVNIQLFDGAIE